MNNILIVDDEQTFLDSLTDGLSDFTGYQVFTASDGKQAMDLLRDTAIDLVVTDLRMPRMGGYALVAHMARKYPAVPVIVMTAFGTHEMEENLRALGVAGYLEKPLDLDELADLIADLLAGQQNGRGARLLSPSGDHLLRVLNDATRSALDGETIIRRGSDIGRVFVTAGRIAWVASSTLNQSLFTCILDSTNISMDDLKGVFEECRRKGLNFGETLIEWQLLDRDTLYDILRRYTATSLLEVLTWRETDVMFVPEKRTYSSSLTFELDEILALIKEIDTENQLGFQLPAPDSVASHAAELTAAIEEKIEVLTALEGFINVGAFTSTGALLAEVSSIGISLADVGALANEVLLEAQQATDDIGLGRGNMVHIEAPGADILVRCFNESENYAVSEPDKAHVHLVLMLEKQSNLAMAKMRLERTIDTLAPLLR